MLLCLQKEAYKFEKNETSGKVFKNAKNETFLAKSEISGKQQAKIKHYF